MRSERTVHAPIEPTPTMATALREVRAPTVANHRKLANGMIGTRKRTPYILSPHLTRLIGIQRLVLTVQRQYQCESDRHFGCRHGKDEDEHHLAIGLRPTCARGDECQTSGV